MVSNHIYAKCLKTKWKYLLLRNGYYSVISLITTLLNSYHMLRLENVFHVKHDSLFILRINAFPHFLHDGFCIAEDIFIFYVMHAVTYFEQHFALNLLCYSVLGTLLLFNILFPVLLPLLCLLNR